MGNYKKKGNQKSNQGDNQEESQNYCEVTVFGETYKLISTDGSFDRINRIARELDSQMKAIAKKYPDFAKYKIAILVALNLTDNLFKHKEGNINNNNTNNNVNNIEQIIEDDSMNQEDIMMRIEKLINFIEGVL